MILGYSASYYWEETLELHWTNGKVHLSANSTGPGIRNTSHEWLLALSPCVMCACAYTHARTHKQRSAYYVPGSLCTVGNQTRLTSALKKPEFSEEIGTTAEQTDRILALDRVI